MGIETNEFYRTRITSLEDITKSIDLSLRQKYGVYKRILNEIYESLNNELQLIRQSLQPIEKHFNGKMEFGETTNLESIKSVFDDTISDRIEYLSRMVSEFENFNWDINPENKDETRYKYPMEVLCKLYPTKFPEIEMMEDLSPDNLNVSEIISGRDKDKKTREFIRYISVPIIKFWPIFKKAKIVNTTILGHIPLISKEGIDSLQTIVNRLGYQIATSEELEELD